MMPAPAALLERRSMELQLSIHAFHCCYWKYGLFLIAIWLFSAETAGHRLKQPRIKQSLG
jgi:hypothetical protein